MKRSHTIRLVVLGSLAGTALTGCKPRVDDNVPAISAGQTYTNNQYVRGAGYYHAAYHGFYPHPHNQHIAGQGYYHGGMWTTKPGETVAASRPSAESVRAVQARSGGTDASSGVRRGGFGVSARSTSS